MPSLSRISDDTRNANAYELASRLTRKLIDAGKDHVPTSTMLDYAFGGYDDELLEAFHGQHLATCESCRRGRDVYRRQRPSDPARLFEVPEFGRQAKEDETYELSPSEAGNRLQEFVAESSGELLIVAGEANPAVYDPPLAAVLKERALACRKAGGPVPQVICGPAMGLNGEIREPSETVLPALAEEGLVELYISQHRQKLHFRISGEDRVYTEEYHEAGRAGERHGYWYRSRPIADLFRRRFQALLKAGLARPAQRDEFVYLSMAKIGAIQEKAGERFDAMTAEELTSMAA